MSRSIHDEELLHDHDHDLDHEYATDHAVGAFSRKTWTMIVAALVVVGAVGAVLVVYTVDEGAVLSVEITGPSRTDDLLTFAYTIRTERAPATGTTTLTVTGDLGVYTRTFQAGGGGGRLDVRLSDFVMGNGAYVFKLQYKEKSGQTTYTIGTPETTNFIVTGIGAPPFPGAEIVTTTYPGGGREGFVNISIYFFSDLEAGIQTRAPPGSMMEMRVSRLGHPDGAPLNVSVEGKTFYTHNFDVASGPGNYTVDVTFMNQWVRADAPVKTITLSNKTFVQDLPTPCVVGSPYHGNNQNSYTITADASCSHDDLGIIQFTWDFGDGTSPVTNGGIPTETHTFPSSAITRTYHGTVCAEDGMSTYDPVLMCAEFVVTTSTN